MQRSEIAGIVVVIAAVFGGLVSLYQLAAKPPSPMENGELLRTARQLASDARESERLVGLIAAGQVNEHYAKLQQRKLSEDVDDARDQLDAPPPRGREADAARMRELATHMRELLDGAPSQLTDREALARMRREHGQLAAELEQIASR